MDIDIKIFRSKDGAKLKYVDEGSGTPFLYIYGMGSSIASQTPFIKLMSEHCRIIVFDQRGYGITEAVGEIGIHQSARDAKDLMDYLGIQKYIVLGYSMGAAVVFSYVNQFGCKNLEKVILGDMSPKLINEDGWNLGLYQGHYTRAMYEKDIDLIRTDYKRFAIYVTEQLMYKNTPQQERTSYSSAEEIRARIINGEHSPLIEQALFSGLVDIPKKQSDSIYYYWVTMADSDFRDVLKRISVPTAIIYATPGSGYAPGTAEYMYSRIPDSILCPMHDCSHMAAAENAPMYMRYLFDFCNIKR